MELRHLRYFVAVAETGKRFSRCNAQTTRSQPAVSRQIRDLEDELGVQLLERTGKAVRLSFVADSCFSKNPGDVGTDQIGAR